jgi:hypothetical protein
MVEHHCNSSIQGAEAEKSLVQGQLGLHREIQSFLQKRKKE